MVIFARSPLKRSPPRSLLVLTLATSLGLIGCTDAIAPKVEAQPERQQGESKPAVEVKTARRSRLRPAPSHTGTTQPVTEVSLRARIEGRLQQLNVDVGDRVVAGQILARLDDAIVQTEIAEAEAELAARQSEVARLRNQVRSAEIQVEQAKAELQQARADARRMRELADAGAVSAQEAELAQTEATVAEQTLRSRREQIAIAQGDVSAALERANAQRSLIAQARERRSYTTLTAPISGAVLARVSEPGNLVQPGNEILKLGDFSQVKTLVPVSELDLADIEVGQAARVRLDAFPDRPLTGRISRISPAADPETRKIPVEVTIANPDRRIGSGLLARVTFDRAESQKIVVPETAVQGESTIFVLNRSGETATVTERTVTLGDRFEGRVEILSGLDVDERFVARSSRSLKSGEPVRLSALSEQ